MENKNILMGTELKFRVFDRVHKSMHIVGTNHHDTFHIWGNNQVSYYNYQNGESSILPGEEILDDESGYILMRYSGKHDMSGKEVYEGDVIENPDGVRMEIRYGIYQGFCPVDKCTMDSVGFYAVAEGNPEMPVGNLEDYAEVVGNIWQDPEMKVGGIE